MIESDTRSRFLDDHARLRGKAEVLESLALRILRGDDDLGSALRLKGEEILDHLVDHMAWEEQKLLPLLGRSGHSELSATLAAEHAAQRRRFEEDLRTLREAERHPVTVAKHVLEFLRWLERDMQSEEEHVLDALTALPTDDVDPCGDEAS